jgi:hypothetical protein
MTKNELRTICVDDCVPLENNTNEMNSEEFDRLVDELADVGFITAITVVELDDGTFRIIGGEHRWRAAMVLGIEEIPAVVCPLEDWDSDRQEFVAVRLNILGGSPNPEKFAVLYTKMADKYGKEPLQDLFAYTDRQAFQKLIGGVKDGLKGSLPKNLQNEFEERSKEAKTVDDLSGIVQELFNRYGDTLDRSFMVFSFGKLEHIYITMHAKMRKAMRRVMDYCAVTGEDINDVMVPIVRTCVTALERKWAEEEKKKKAASPAEEHVDL